MEKSQEGKREAAGNGSAMLIQVKRGEYTKERRDELAGQAQPVAEAESRSPRYSLWFQCLKICPPLPCTLRSVKLGSQWRKRLRHGKQSTGAYFARLTGIHKKGTRLKAFDGINPHPGSRPLRFLPHPRTTPAGNFLGWIFCFALVMLQLFGSGDGRAQTAKSLGQVKKLYVESFGEDDASNKARDRVIAQLGKNRKLEMVTAPSAADAVLKGSAKIWVVGYFSTDARVPSNARQAILHGYLSVEILGKESEPLWSYLVTPRKYRSGAISEDLADQIVSRLNAALEHKIEKPSAGPANEPTVEVKLNAAGATFPAPLYQKWFETFQLHRPNTKINYSAVGSDAGLRLLTAGKVDFAASDVPVSDEEVPEAKRPLKHYATVLGAVVPIYNLKGTDRNLNFTGETLAEIYLGKIKKWNDPKIRESNRGLHLPDSEIVVIHRSDGSGTTYVWTDYLSKVDAEWRSAVGAGSVVQWPAGTGVEGNDAVATKVQQTANSIGYVELVYAFRHQLSFGAVRNADGEFIQADLASLSAAGRGAAEGMSADMRVSLTNAPGKGAYPIATFTWWLLPADLLGVEKKAALLELLEWVLTSGQKECSALGYAPLPREIASRELQLLSNTK